MSSIDEAVATVVATINRRGGGAGFRHDQVAVQWPSLAAALAELMDAHGTKPPGVWRLARRELHSNHG